MRSCKLFPPGLDSLDQRMMEQIYNCEEADLRKQILASTAIVYRLITLRELTSLVEKLEDISDKPKPLRETIGLLWVRSYLTIREGAIYSVHQSTKDYLFTREVHKKFPSGLGAAHHKILSRSLQILSKTLCRDMYSLCA